MYSKGIKQIFKKEYPLIQALHKLRLNLNNNSTELICRVQLQFSKRFSKVLSLQATYEEDEATLTPNLQVKLLRLSGEGVPQS